MRPDRPHAWVGCVAAGAVLVTLGVALGLQRTAPAQPAHAIPTVNVGHVPASPVLPAVPRTSAGTTRRARAVTLPRGSHLLVRGDIAPIRRVHVVAHEMQIPRDPRTVGWWSAGAAPGASTGTAVIVGHVNYSGVSGTLAVLPQLRPGDAVTVAEPHHALRYRVVAVRTYPKTTGIPREVFAMGGPARLVLITCGGPFDAATGNYEDNIVAYAQPA